MPSILEEPETSASSISLTRSDEASQSEIPQNKTKLTQNVYEEEEEGEEDSSNSTNHILIPIKKAKSITLKSNHNLERIQFNCSERSEGYYADVEQECKVFHYCKSNGLKFSFRCPGESLFNQEQLSCDAEMGHRNCRLSTRYYFLNSVIYQRKLKMKKHKKKDFAIEDDWLPHHNDPNYQFETFSIRNETSSKIYEPYMETTSTISPFDEIDNSIKYHTNHTFSRTNRTKINDMALNLDSSNLVNMYNNNNKDKHKEKPSSMPFIFGDQIISDDSKNEDSALNDIDNSLIANDYGSSTEQPLNGDNDPFHTDWDDDGEPIAQEYHHHLQMKDPIDFPAHLPHSNDNYLFGKPLETNFHLHQLTNPQFSPIEFDALMESIPGHVNTLPLMSSTMFDHFGNLHYQQQQQHQQQYQQPERKSHLQNLLSNLGFSFGNNKKISKRKWFHSNSHSNEPIYGWPTFDPNFTPFHLFPSQFERRTDHYDQQQSRHQSSFLTKLFSKLK